MENGQEEQVIVLPFIIPLPMFKLISAAAVKQGKTVDTFVSDAIREKIKKLGGQTTPEIGG